MVKIGHPSLRSACAVTAIFLLTAQSPLKQADDVSVGNTHERVRAQETIDAIDDETRELFAEYKNVLRQNNALKSYNEQLAKLVESQEEDIRRKQEEIGRAKGFERDILPLLERMADALERWLEKDMPFREESRKTSLAQLREAINRHDISSSEKFRRVLLAYQDESDYGKTMESFRGTVAVDEGREHSVDFLRIGRIIWLYQSLDKEHHAIWDRQTREWRDLPDDWQREISRGVQMARKQVPPDLLILPILP